MQVLGAILTAGLFIAARCQLFDRSVIEDGGSFNLTCDVSRIGDVPAAVTEICQLSIERGFILNSGVGVTVLVRYLLRATDEQLEKNTPDNRPWVIDVSGGRYPSTQNNRASIKIALYVPDAKCSDAGLYVCKAGFRQGGLVSEATRSDTITYKARLEEPVLTLDPHNGNAPDVSTNTAGQVVKLTCTFEGPAGLEVTWLTGPSGGTDFVPYPIDVIQMLTPSSILDRCKRRRFESTLTLKVPAVDTTYICVVKDGNVGASQKNFKIVIKKSNKATHFGTMDPHWFVRNMLVMVVASLLMPRYV
ncbi:unnamed protein product [Lymnaea stagnalis]|uniref:Ig-like domain-containing protein n=1 Tax=Lymnaea stagnalis TaxID=6523 RepID=A0AAV2IJK7_LYMST